MAKKPKSPSLKLAEEMAALTSELKDQNNFWRKFWSGIVIGFGTGIGATLVAGVVIFFIVQFLMTIGLEGIVNSTFFQMLFEER